MSVPSSAPPSVGGAPVGRGAGNSSWKLAGRTPASSKLAVRRELEDEGNEGRFPGSVTDWPVRGAMVPAAGTCVACSKSSRRVLCAAAGWVTPIARPQAAVNTGPSNNAARSFAVNDERARFSVEVGRPQATFGYYREKRGPTKECSVWGTKRRVTRLKRPRIVPSPRKRVNASWWLVTDGLVSPRRGH